MNPRDGPAAVGQCPSHAERGDGRRSGLAAPGRPSAAPPAACPGAERPGSSATWAALVARSPWFKTKNVSPLVRVRVAPSVSACLRECVWVCACLSVSVSLCPFWQHGMAQFSAAQRSTTSQRDTVDDTAITWVVLMSLMMDTTRRYQTPDAVMTTTQAMANIHQCRRAPACDIDLRIKAHIVAGSCAGHAGIDIRRDC